MLKQKNMPSVYHDDGAVTGIGFYMLSYGRDPIALDFDAGDFLYFGRYKPFHSIYVEMSVVNTVTATLTVEYHNGTSYVAVDNLLDETNGFKRSGFIHFDLPTDWAESTVASDEKYYIRISSNVDLTGTMAFQGMNIVYSDDQDLKSIYPGIMAYLNQDLPETTYILRHENSRNLIVQDIRNRGFTKKRALADRYEAIDEWDLIHVEEVRQWSTYLTLANIFSSLQSNQTDLYKEKAEDFEKKAEAYKAAFYLTLDKDDDGAEDSAESQGDIHSRRLVRR